MVSKEQALNWIKENPKKFKLYISVILGLMFLFIFLVATTKIYLKKSVNYVLIVDGQPLYSTEFNYYCTILAQISDEYSNDRGFKHRCAKIISEMKAIKNDAENFERKAFDYLEPIVKLYAEKRLSDIYLEKRFIEFEKSVARKKILDDIKTNEMELTLDEYIKKDAENQNLHKSLNYKWDIDFFRLRLFSDCFLSFKVNEQLGKLITMDAIRKKYEETIDEYRVEQEFYYDYVVIPYKYVANDFMKTLKKKGLENIESIVGNFKRYNLSFHKNIKSRASELKAQELSALKNTSKTKKNITELVDLKKGYRLFILKKVIPESVKPLKEVKDIVVNKIYKSSFRKVKEKIKKEILDHHKLFINQEVLRKL